MTPYYIVTFDRLSARAPRPHPTHTQSTHSKKHISTMTFLPVESPSSDEPPPTPPSPPSIPSVVPVKQILKKGHHAKAELPKAGSPFYASPSKTTAGVMRTVMGFIEA